MTSDADKVGTVDQALLDEFAKECGLSGPFRVEVDLKGETTSQVHEFRQPFLVVGRRAGSDLMLDHWLVSRRHAYLQLIEGRFFCVDLGSRTGTHGGDATERSGWLDPVRAIQIGPYSVRPDLPPADLSRDYPPLPVVTWTIPTRDQSTKTWTMNRGLALVGRSPACRIRIAEPDVSRFHCSLVLTAGGVWAIDLLSRRPIAVNGRPVRIARIAPGDELAVGQQLLTASYDLPSARGRLGGSPPPSTVVDLRPPLASTVPPDPTRDRLPALAPPVLVPDSWERPSFGASSDESLVKGVDPTVTDLVQQFGAMQQQMFDQFHQTMMMMFEGFAKLHRETSSSIRDEFEEVRRLSREIESLREETARLAEATTMSLQDSAFRAADRLGPRAGIGVASDPAPPPSPTPRPEPPPPKVVPEPPDPHVDIHAQLFHRLNTIEAERQSRWQKILKMMATKS